MIDAHAHLDAAFGGGWDRRPARELLAVLDEAGVDVLVDLSGGWGADVLERHLRHFAAAAPGRFAHFAGVDWSPWSALGAGFGAHAAAELERQLDRGARGLKVWKSLGLEVRDDAGSLVEHCDERLDPIWDVCAERSVPVVVHVGDPAPFFEPFTDGDPVAATLRRHPEWHWHVRSSVGRDDLLAGFDALLERRRDVRFVGAHLLDLVDRPDRLDRLLTRHRHLWVDLGARFDELAAGARPLAEVVVRHFDRVLYGSDHPPGVGMYRSTVAVTERVIATGLAAAPPGTRFAAVRDAVLDGNARALLGP